MYEGAHRKNARRDREPPGKWLTRSDVAQLTGSVSVGAIAKHKEVASTDGGGEGPDSQAPAQTSCSLYCWGLRAERAGASPPHLPFQRSVASSDTPEKPLRFNSAP